MVNGDLKVRSITDSPQPYTIGSVFSGVGGGNLGFEAAGFKTLFHVEIDEFCQKVLTKHWPETVKIRDVKDAGSHNLPKVDLMLMGLPCQPHSLSGLRKGEDDERDLWSECFRLLDECRPKVGVIENVRGLLSSGKGDFFKRVLGDLASIGYDAEWAVLRASDYGFPHQRERVFVVTYPNGTGLQGCVSAKEEGMESAIREGARRSSTSVSSELLSAPPTRDEVLAFSRVYGNYYGLSDRVDRFRTKRLKAIGNAIVPHVSYQVALRVLSMGVL